MFGKVLSISDDLMWRYYELLSFQSLDVIAKLKAEVESGNTHPKKAKVDLAKEIIARFHSDKEAEKAEEEFNQVFAKKELPDEIEEFKISLKDGGVGLLEIMTQAGLTKSNGEARRLVQQGGVKIDQEKVTDVNMSFGSSAAFIIQAGKRKFKKVLIG